MDWNAIVNIWVAMQALILMFAFVIFWVAFMVLLVIGPYWLFVWAIGDGQKKPVKKEVSNVS
jgi:hypothetical protein